MQTQAYINSNIHININIFIHIRKRGRNMANNDMLSKEEFIRLYLEATPEIREQAKKMLKEGIPANKQEKKEEGKQ